MKNILRNKEASFPLKKALLPVIALVIIIAVVVVYYNPVTDYWEEPTQFGSWRDKIEIGFKNGDIKSLKLIGETPVLTTYYEGVEIDYIRYKIDAFADGEGFTKAIVQKAGMEVYVKLMNSGNLLDSGVFLQAGTVDVPIGSTKNIVTVSISMDTWMNNQGYSTGIYTFSFDPEGICEYYGAPADDPEWKEVTLPSVKTISVAYYKDSMGQISIVLSDSITVE